MDLGISIVLAAIWLFAGAAWVSRNVSGGGAWIALIVAVIFTAINV
jgi:hypothetical protein